MTRAFRPTTPDRLVTELADLLAAAEPAGRALRVAVDGAPPTAPAELATALLAPLRERGHPATVVRADTFWRDASLRLEYGREDADEFAQWLDTAALRRELLDPLGPGGSGRYLPSLRDPVTNRATREPARAAEPGAVVISAGALLLGRGLPFDRTIHLSLSPAALRRRAGPADAWTLAAFTRYAADVRPEEIADVVIRSDDAARPAVLMR